MRYFCLLASLSLLHSVTGVDYSRNELINKNETRDSGENEKIFLNKLGKKRESHGHAHRSQRQVGYFETSGENLGENEFATQEVRGPGIREDEKQDIPHVRSVKSPYDQESENLQNSDTMRVGEESNPKFQLFQMNDNAFDSDDAPFRKQRQAKHFEPTSEVLRGPDKPEVNKNFINLLRWNKNKEASTDLFPPGIQKNEAYPVNDDVADFAVYLNKTNKRKTKYKIGAPNSSWDRRLVDLTEDNQLTSDYSDWLSHSQPNRKLNSEEIPNEVNYSENGPQSKKVSDNNADDFLFPAYNLKWDRTKNYYQRKTFDPYLSIRSLIKSASVNDNDAENEHPDSVESQEENSGVVGDVVREKTITLPEPLVFNSSHVVASFVYTMIPFRSPLLNLLENDKHSKYIMIKIDPVLQPSKRISMSDTQLLGDNIEYTLEKNVMRVINKLISTDFQWDLTSVEGHPKSKQKYKNNRYNRHSEELDTYTHPSSPDKIKRFNGVIS